MEQSENRIGEVASRALVSVDTVRYYERLSYYHAHNVHQAGFVSSMRPGPS